MNNPDERGWYNMPPYDKENAFQRSKDDSQRYSHGWFGKDTGIYDGDHYGDHYGKDALYWRNYSTQGGKSSKHTGGYRSDIVHSAGYGDSRPRAVAGGH